MTALLELKQKIKGVYGQYEMYFLPVLKFILAMVYFVWINANMGYMSQLDNIFLVMILGLICSILPSAAMMYVGFVLILGHSYALGIEVAGFMLVLILLMLIFFLRFSGGQNVDVYKRQVLMRSSPEVFPSITHLEPARSVLAWDIRWNLIRI